MSPKSGSFNERRFNCAAVIYCSGADLCWALGVYFAILPQFHPILSIGKNKARPLSVENSTIILRTVWR